MEIFNINLNIVFYNYIYILNINEFFYNYYFFIYLMKNK